MSNPKEVNKGEMKGQNNNGKNRKQVKKKILIIVSIYMKCKLNNSIKYQSLSDRIKSKIQRYTIDKKHRLTIRGKDLRKIFSIKTLTEES